MRRHTISYRQASIGLTTHPTIPRLQAVLPDTSLRKGFPGQTSREPSPDCPTCSRALTCTEIQVRRAGFKESMMRIPAPPRQPTAWSTQWIKDVSQATVLKIFDKSSDDASVALLQAHRRVRHNEPGTGTRCPTVRRPRGRVHGRHDSVLHYRSLLGHARVARAPRGRQFRQPEADHRRLPRCTSAGLEIDGGISQGTEGTPRIWGR